MSISRKTKPVKLILDTFNNNDYAISVVDLVSIFKNKMNKTTVYRILNRLEESNILHSFNCPSETLSMFGIKCVSIR